MRIVYISDSAIPSSSPNSVHVMKMCQAFSDLGHEVTLVAKKTTACLKNVKDVHDFYAVKKNFKVRIYPSIAFRGSGMFYNVSLAWRAFGISADLIYTRSITAAFFFLAFRRPVVFEVHEPYEGKGSRLKKMFRFIAYNKRLRKLVVISEALKSYYKKEFSLRDDLIFVSHDGADPFPPASPIIINDQFKVGYVGSLLVGKGMEILIPLAKRCPQVEFHVVGGNEKQIHECSQKSGNIKNLIFHGFKTQNELPSYIISFDAVIAPYSSYVKVSNKEGANNLALWMSPLKIFEYMSANKPIIASRLGVITEILQHEKNALLCDPEDLKEWEIAIHRLRDEVGLRKELARNALTNFARHHTWRNRVERILEVLKK